MTDLTHDQIAEREAARRGNGQFGERVNSDPEFELDDDGNAYRDHAAPTTVTVRLQRWSHRDDLEEVGTVRFDGRAILDARSLSDLTRAHGNSDNDWIFGQAQENGLLDGHDGPFDVELPDDFEDYLIHRTQNGITDPDPSATEALAVTKMDTHLAMRRQLLSEAARLLADAGEGATFDKPNADLRPGDVLVHGTSRLTVGEGTPSSAMPGFLAVECEFGVLHLDPERTSAVERGSEARLDV